MVIKPIRSVIIRVINKIGRPRSGSSILLTTSMSTDNAKFSYQLIKNMTKFEKQTNYRIKIFLNKNITVEFYFWGTVLENELDYLHYSACKLLTY